MSHVEILHQPADRSDGDLHPHGDRGRRCHPGPAGRSVSQHRPAGGADTGHLHRRRRPDDRAVGCHPHRAANERGGQHELHVFLKRRQRADENDRGLRRENGPEHRSDTHPDTRDTSFISASDRCHELWDYGPEDTHSSPHAHQPVLTARDLRRTVSGQLRLHQPQRSSHTLAWHRQRAGFRRWQVRDEAVGQARPIGQAGYHRP